MNLVEIKRFLASKYSISSIEFKQLQRKNTVKADIKTSAGKRLSFFCKLPLNSRIITGSIKHRETLFFEIIAKYINVSTPTWYGCTKTGIQIFEYLPVEDAAIDLDEKIDTLEIIHSTHIDLDLDGDFDNVDTVLSFAEQQIYKLERTDLDNLLNYVKESTELIGDAIEYLQLSPQCLVHGDFWSGNLLKVSNTTYVVDWENVQLNTPYYDLATLYYTTKFIDRIPLSMMSFRDRCGFLRTDLDFQLAIEYTFILQTLLQVLPAFIFRHNHFRYNHRWKNYWIENFISLVEKYKS